ncbi:response regulator transcription factor [Chelativorans sp. AA-79]|uniref:response regulator transcription factor n=1 Tax=Chelativorans sp. AA-79 TaxID=3028735 RepID=UPI0023F6BFC1|nr:response regulator transcription factor [Chelativorans sp. AA-79]WEX10493.1 response regulator transcription factor [Chelativorans sp. AA-79]
MEFENGFSPGPVGKPTPALPLDLQTSSDFNADMDIGREPKENLVLLIDPRALGRECLAQSLRGPDTDIVAVGSADEWRKSGNPREPSAVLFIVGSRKIADAAVRAEIQSLAEEFDDSPVIVVADSDDLGQILTALDSGARGYIPSNVGVSVAAEAIHLAQVGGVFVPASGVLAMRDVINSTTNRAAGLGSLFTSREAEVAEALRRGKANKIIAYELQLCESTVKVHIRNIMKKLNATNRTEVAYKIREMMS